MLCCAIPGVGEERGGEGDHTLARGHSDIRILGVGHISVNGKKNFFRKSLLT